MSNAQTIEMYYDQNWKPCEPSCAWFYGTLEKTDSGWLAYDFHLGTKKVLMKGLYIDSSKQIKNGIFHWYHTNGNLKSYGLYQNNQKEGIWVDFHSNGNMSDSAKYSNGKITGIGYKWYSDGYLSDSISVDPMGRAVLVSWFPNGNIASAGRLNESGEQNGKWQYYYKQGGVSSSEIYDAGKLVDYKHYAPDGSIMNDTVTTEIPCSFPGGGRGWARYIEGRLLPLAESFNNSEKVVVTIQFEVDEEGKVKNPELKAPSFTEFDKIALDIIKTSPKWIPAKAHNRNIPSITSRSITLMRIN